MSKMERKEAIPLGAALQMFIKQSGLSMGHNTQRVFQAWDQASGAGKYTLKRFYRDGRLYITVGSSVIRSQLAFQKEALLEKINSILKEDELFIADETRVSFVKELILK